MPKRTTLTYSSEDAPEVRGNELHVYYCKYSGRHVLTTNCDLSRAPKRRTDGSTVLDTAVYTYKLYTVDGGVKVLKRKNGQIEKQYRQNAGKLPIAYRSEPDGRFLYLLPDSVTAQSLLDGERGGREKPPVPPCILPIDTNATQISLEIDDRADQPEVIKVSADAVRIAITHGIAHEAAGEEVINFLRGVLGVRLGQLSLMRGESTRHKLVTVKELAPAAVFDKLQAQLNKQKGS
ncbi:probable UPF0428 protein CXorf56 homolog at N-terminal half [Coccomyxa sp. Obi]|nr:probable UPF0428 protein CXorf56 homolog at N-terminal half [Coccomyxa sp. Obi]